MTSPTNEQITRMCERGFGPSCQIESIQELGGGTFNTTYLITLADTLKVILRISPPLTTQILWDEAVLMRREHSMLPFFAPVAALMAKTLFIDFTHQLIDRDYIFQTLIEGERWDDVVEELTSAENSILWEQFGSITKQIHEVRGKLFGLPLPGFQFPLWSQTVMNRLERILRSAKDHELKVPHLAQILDLVRAHPGQLDEIQVPCLLHGDLWLFNLLIRRAEQAPAIVGILDADRAWWGDPMADWTMFILAHAQPEEGHSHFWRTYGRPEETPSTRFRRNVYDAMHAGTAFIWAVQHQDDETVKRATDILHEVKETLPALL